MIAAAYARYSTEHQCSIEVQLYKIKQYCIENDLELPENYIYYDEAVSGMLTEQRHGFQKLLQVARNKEIDCIVLYDITRGSRDVENWLRFRKEMNKLHIPIYSVIDRLGNLDNPTDFLTELITVGMGQTHVLTSRQKSMDKIDMLAKEGKFLGGYAPFGYQIKDGQYYIIEWEAEIIRQIFGMYANGKSYKDILLSLPDGLVGRRGRPFGRNTLHEILKNERYVGVYTWCKREVKYLSEWAGGGPSERAVRIENAIPAIVDMETWRKVCLRMEQNKHNTMNNTRKENRTYLLSGLMRCGHCGASLSGVTTTNKKGYEYKFYTCTNKRRLHNCKAKNIAANDIEPLVVNLIKRDVLNRSLLEKTAEAIIAISENSGKSEQFLHLRNELASVDSKINNLMNALMDGLDSEAVRNKLAELEAQKKIIQQKIKIAQPAKELSKEFVIQQLEKDIDKLEADPGAIAELIKKYVTSVVVYDDRIEINTTADLALAADRLSSEMDIKKVYTADDDSVNGVGCGSRI